MIKGGYWFPYLHPDRQARGDAPWFPAFRNPDGTVGETLALGFEKAGDVMAYLRRSGLAAWAGVGPRPYEDQRDRPDLSRPETVALPDPFSMDEDPFDELMADDRPDGMPDDPRFEWVEISTFSGHRQWTKGRCNHLTPAPVDLRTGQLVAWWCPDCGDQFEWDRWPVPDHLWVPLPEVNRSKVTGVEMLVPGVDVPEMSEFKKRYREIKANENPAVLPGGYVIEYRKPRPNVLIEVWNGFKGIMLPVRHTWPIWLVMINYILLIMTGKL